jgi:hypothetical protein
VSTWDWLAKLRRLAAFPFVVVQCQFVPQGLGWDKTHQALVAFFSFFAFLVHSFIDIHIKEKDLVVIFQKLVLQGTVCAFGACVLGACASGWTAATFTNDAEVPTATIAALFTFIGSLAALLPACNVFAIAYGEVTPVEQSLSMRLLSTSAPLLCAAGVGLLTLFLFCPVSNLLTGLAALLALVGSWLIRQAKSLSTPDRTGSDPVVEENTCH